MSCGQLGDAKGYQDHLLVADITKMQKACDAFDAMWELEQSLLKQYVSVGQPMPSDRISLPAGMQVLISEYFYSEDAPIFNSETSCAEAADIKLRPGLIPAANT